MHVSFLAFIILGTVSAFPKYQDEIPNGHNVPNPCDGGKTVWLAVGHYNPTQHTAEKNPFGQVCFFDVLNIL